MDSHNKITIAMALVATNLCASVSEAKRLIRGGGAYVNGVRVESENAMVPSDGACLLRAGRRGAEVLYVRS